MYRKTLRGKALLSAVFLCALSLTAVSGYAQVSSTPTLAPLPYAFQNYTSPTVPMVQTTAGAIPSGLVPEPIDLTHNSSASAMGLFTATSLPATYDLRTQGKLTPVRNQGSSGCCWDFATIGSLESFLMPGQSCDFSENNLKNRSGFDIGPNSGGNRSMSAAYLTRWSGPVSEADDPYNASSTTSPAGLPVRMHVQDIAYIPDRTGPLDNDAIKQGVMQYGAIYTTYYHSDSYYKSSTYSYYFNGSTNGNHAVCIVGWDDDYDKSKFSITPPGNGAFIVRNSWGSYWGQSGYFYMSYYDTLFGQENAAFTGDAISDYDTIYQYDPLGWTGSMGYGSTTAYFANVFTASQDDDISAASWYAASDGSTYQVSVYVSPTSGPINSAGPASTTTGTIAQAGYHTVVLSTPVSVSAGQKFSVVVKETTPGYKYPIPIERPMSGYCSAATASAGQSYISGSGSSWSDLTSSYSNTNVCLKAFGTQGSGTTAGTLGVTPSNGLTSTGNAGGPFSPSAQSYTLTNNGDSAIDWTASNTQSWLTLSATSGSLAPGTSTNVVVSIGSGADTLAAGTYTDTVKFTNGTNGNGSTSRAVSLTVSGAATLSVTPSTTLSSTGPVGGPFSPSSIAYTLKNTGGTTLSWTAAKGQTWVSLSSASGSLTAGASTTVTVSINSGANSLAAGSYSDSVKFTNTTNSQGGLTASVNLQVSGSSAKLSVGPSTGFTASGAAGGPFSPSSQVYTLTNIGASSLNWTAGKSASWLSLSSASGTLAAGASVSVTASINTAANSLPASTYTGSVSFTNTTNGSGNASRTVGLSVGGSSTYRVIPATYSWIDPTNHTKLMTANNAYNYVQAIPFAFKLYDRTYTYLYIGSNGMLGFAGSGMTSGANTDLPNSGTPNSLICGYWDDLNPASGTLRMTTLGSAPNRRLVMSWVGVPHASYPAATFTFQIILCESTNDIVVQYQNVSPTETNVGGGRSATIGIEDSTGTQACKYSYNTAGSVSNGQAIRFTTQTATVTNWAH